nr:GntR family transcriptional regulator [Comamonas kerstersii]
MRRKKATTEQTLNLQSLQERIRVALEEDIYRGALVPGQAIREQELCERFQASRTPVREALLLMSAKGLIRIQPRSGIYVSELDAREIIAIMEGLAELEAVLARLAAQRITEALQAKLLTYLGETEQHAHTVNPEAYVQANAEFHDVIYQASGNDYIVEQTKNARLLTAPYRTHMFAKPERLLASHAEHELIAQAIMARDGEKAAQLMRAHILAGGQAFADAVLRASDLRRQVH